MFKALILKESEEDGIVLTNLYHTLQLVGVGIIAPLLLSNLATCIKHVKNKPVLWPHHSAAKILSWVHDQRSAQLTMLNVLQVLTRHQALSRILYVLTHLIILTSQDWYYNISFSFCIEAHSF